MKKILMIKKFNLLIAGVLFFSGFFLFLILSRWLISNDYKVAINKVERQNVDDFLAVFDTHLDHYVIYHNVYNIIDNVKKADILILGNSQSLFGIHHEIVNQFEKQSNMKVFNMAFGHDEGFLFPMKIIEKYKLRPKLILVDVWIFKKSNMSQFGELVANSTRFDALKNSYEANVAMKVERFLMNWFFRFSINPERDKRALIYRSFYNGTYSFKNISDINGTAVDLENINPDQPLMYSDDLIQLNNLLAFKKTMETQGVKLILFTVPGRGYNPYIPFLKKLSKDLETQIILPNIKNINVFDGRHLTEESAQKLSEVIFNQLKKIIN